MILDLVLNHTSTLHPWFQRARWAPKHSPERDVYVWSDDPNRYSEAPVLFRHFEASNWEWDEVAQQYSLHRFLRLQPDLNYENPLVQGRMRWSMCGLSAASMAAWTPLNCLKKRSVARGCRRPAFLQRLRQRVEPHGRDMLLAEAIQPVEKPSIP